MTTVNVALVDIDDASTPPRRAEPDTTVIEVAPAVIGPVSVVCCEREEYLRSVIQFPIG